MRNIYAAARDGDLGAVKKIISENPALANTRANFWDPLPIRVAIQCGHVELVEYLLPYTKERGATMLADARFSPNQKIKTILLKLLLRKKDIFCDGTTEAHFQAALGNTPYFENKKELLQKPNNVGVTPYYFMVLFNVQYKTSTEAQCFVLPKKTEIQNYRDLAYYQSSLGRVFDAMEDADLTIKYYAAAIHSMGMTANETWDISYYLDLMAFYSKVAELYRLSERHALAIENYNNAIFAIVMTTIDKQKDWYYQKLSELYYSRGLSHNSNDGIDLAIKDYIEAINFESLGACDFNPIYRHSLLNALEEALTVDVKKNQVGSAISRLTKLIDISIELDRYEEVCNASYLVGDLFGVGTETRLLGFIINVIKLNQNSPLNVTELHSIFNLLYFCSPDDPLYSMNCSFLELYIRTVKLTQKLIRTNRIKNKTFVSEIENFELGFEAQFKLIDGPQEELSDSREWRPKSPDIFATEILKLKQENQTLKAELENLKRQPSGEAPTSKKQKTTKVVTFTVDSKDSFFQQQRPNNLGLIKFENTLHK